MAKQRLNRLLKWVGLSAQGDLGPLTCWVNHNGKLVVIPRAPPLNPPSPDQENLRAFFKSSADSWNALTASQRKNWLNAARRANLRITGWNLYLWYMWSGDALAIGTVERQSGITLL